MKRARQFAKWSMALILSAGLAGVSAAQRQDHNAPMPRPESSRPASRVPAASRAQSPAPRQQSRQREQTPVTRGGRPYSGSANAGRAPRNPNRSETNLDRRGYDRPNGNRQDLNRPNSERQNFNRENGNPNRPPAGQYSSRGGNNGGYREQQNRLSPEDRQRVIQNQQRFRQLSPQQQQDLRERGRVWQQMTPQQRDHIKNDVLPAWRNMPPQRQKAIEQRLGVLQNMPESARNRHLNDPYFTRGMSDDDRSTLRDLSHLHVGGAPDPPNE
jgi:hypothetical protein